MAILIMNDGDKIVNTIADRDGITKKFDGMQVTVKDAIADINVGEGEALYQWSTDKNRWILIGKDKKDNLEFITETGTLVGGKVTATEVPQSGLVWDCFVKDSNGLIIADITAPSVTVKEINIGSTAYDGSTLHFTYGYGKIQAAIVSVMGDGGLLSIDTNAPSNMTGVVVADGTKLTAKTLTPSDISGFDAQAVTATASAISSAVSTAVTDLVGGAPGALDTLKEIADHLASDESAVSALTTTVGTKAATTYVDTELAKKADTSSLASVAVSGDYADLSNKPTIPTVPTVVSAFTNDSGYQTASDVSAAITSAAPSLTGSTSVDFSSKDLTVSGDIMPSANGVSSIGSATKKFAAIYTQEMHIDANTLYVDGVPVLGSSANTIQITANLHQGMRIATTGDGILVLDSQAATTIKTNGPDADVLIQSAGQGSMTRLTSGEQIILTAKTVNIQGNESVSGNLTVAGNFTVQGTTTSVETTNMAVKDNIITVNKGEQTEGVSLRYSGFDVDRGALARQRLVWDETAGKWKMGATGSELNIASETYVDTAITGKVNTSSLAAVATSGSYSDLSNKPILFSGSYSDLSNKPTIPTVPAAVSAFTNDSNYQTATQVTTAIQAVVGAAPAALDTLKEIADQLTIDGSAVAALTTTVSGKAPLESPTFTGTVSGITKAMVGLGSADNTSDAAKPVSTAQQTALNLKAPLASPTFTGTVSGITKAMVGLGSVDNTSDAAKPVSTATQTALDAKAPLASPTFTGTVSGINKAMVGLGSVDNTSDAAKPVSTAQATAIALKADQATTYTKTETDSRIQAVIGAAPAALDTLAELATALGNDASYASTITSSLALKAPLASPTFTGTVSGITKAMVGLGSVDNTADTAKPVSTAQQTALNLKANLASPTFTGTVSGITKAMVGLTDVDNTSDAAKPVSTATQTALNLKANLASPTFTGTVSGITATMVGLGSVTNDKQLKDSQTLAVTGDATASATALNTGTIALTLASSGVTAGTYNNAATTHTPFTVDAKGRVTSTGTAVTITPAFSSITSKPTTLAGYGITDAAAASHTQAWSTITSTPTTLAGYGITDAGYLNIPQVSNSANYTTVLTDSGKHLLHPSADTTARTFTIAANASVAYPIGTTIAFVNQNAAGALTIAIATDTMRLAGAGTTGSRTLAANGIATAVKITATEWIISGTNLT